MTDRQHRFIEDAINFVRGVLMGGADVIPGVSGGTVALIVGIYERLVTAISRFDLTLTKLLSTRQWNAAARHVDLRFLASLGLGIMTGIVTLGSLINHLLTNAATRSMTWAAFFGAIAGSCLIVARLARPQSRAEGVLCYIVGAVGAVIAFALTSNGHHVVEPSHQYILFCGMLGICAMILPGISGAFILVVLGVYVHLTDYLKAIPKGEITADAIVTVTVFGAGCACGLLIFSKLLRWFLMHFKSLTMATMCGFMIGALNKIWPIQRDLTPKVLEFKHKRFENVLPDSLDGQLIAYMAIAAASMLLILGLDWMTRQFQTNEAAEVDRAVGD